MYANKNYTMLYITKLDLAEMAITREMLPKTQICPLHGMYMLYIFFNCHFYHITMPLD